MDYYNQNNKSIATSWCKTHNHILYWPIREEKLLPQCLDPFANDDIWYTIFPRQCYEMTGKELKVRAKLYNITFAKCIYPDGNRGYIFKYGENVDTKEFSPHGECSEGGLYFTLERMIGYYYQSGYSIAEITVDDDARVWIENWKMKADKINIVSIITYEGKSDSEYCRIRKKKLCIQIHDDKLYKEIFPCAGIEITGYELNQISSRYDMTFAKFIYKKNKRMFNCGKNVAKEFCPRKLCISGGIYFTLECLMIRYEECGDTIVEITIDDDARIWIEDGKMKADKINIVGAIYIQ